LRIGKNQKKGVLPKKAMISPNILADDFKPPLSAPGLVNHFPGGWALFDPTSRLEGRIALWCGPKSRMPLFLPPSRKNLGYFLIT
jgi:hypothetical protein